jgi:nucleotide-binding universal stress UspA family protein
VLKDIVVQLTGSTEDNVRLAHAEGIAAMFGAHLTGLLQHQLPQFVVMPGASAAGYIEMAYADAREGAQANLAEARRRFESLGVANDLREVEALPAMIGDAMAAEARLADLFVGTRPYGDPAGEHRIEEAVLFNSGRGCLFVPPESVAPATYRTIMVAWKNTRESARALAESLPFLLRAEQVVVVVVEEGGSSEEAGISTGTDIARHLSRHGIAAEIRRPSGWSNSGEAILNEAVQVGADMLVIGGYGHSRLREWLLGGVTRHVLSNASMPVLMAH